MSETVTIEGLAELKDALRQLPDATAKNVLRRVGKARLQPLADEMEKNAPRLTGKLAASVTVGTKLSRRQRALATKFGSDDVELYAGPGPLRQATMQEFGTREIAAKPFVRPVWDTQKNELLDGIAADLWKEVDKAAARLARKAARAMKV
jgi:HK97 gp10 family phage protein